MIKDFNIYEIFPTEDSYKTFLYNLKFKNLLICPYCYSNKISTYKNLFHCNICNNKSSITTNTIMQGITVVRMKASAFHFVT